MLVVYVIIEAKTGALALPKAWSFYDDAYDVYMTLAKEAGNPGAYEVKELEYSENDEY